MGAIERAVGAVDRVAQVAADRPHATWTTLSVEAGEHGLPLTDRPAIALSKQYFRLGPTAAGGIVELRLPDPATLVTRAYGGAPLRTAIDGQRLFVEPPCDGRLVLDLAVPSHAGGPLEFQVDRVNIGDLDARVVAGADVLGPPAYANGAAERVLRMDERGWEFTSPAERSSADYVHTLDENVQSHFTQPWGEPFTATASYTGRVDGHAAEGPIASVRRGLKRLVTTAGGMYFHATEHLR